MSNLQLALIAGGIVLVVGVVIFNIWQERRIRRRIDEAFRPVDARPAATSGRVEPTLRGGDSDGEADRGSSEAPRPGAMHDVGSPAATLESSFEPPMDVIATQPVDLGASEDAATPMSAVPEDAEPAPVVTAYAAGPQPDPDIECIATLQPTQPTAVGALAAGLHARLGKPLRWFGHQGEGGSWTLLAKDTPGVFVEFAACMLLADRNGAASTAQLETFVRIIGEIAPTLPAAFTAPDLGEEAARAETLDQLCADLDVQIGLTVQKSAAAPIPGTRLRGVAEAAGFKLAPSGRFEYVNEETGHVDYLLQNVRDEPFTTDSLRLTATHGVVFILDVPRLADPVRSFDRMKLAAKRMARTLGGEVVDDNGRPLDDAALAAIRAQVEEAAAALKRRYIEPGSARAMALFGA